MTGWRLQELDPRIAAKASLPPHVAVPADLPDEAELTRSDAAAWAAAYLAEQPGPDDPGLARLVAKEPHWDAAEEPLMREDWDAVVPLVERILEIDPDDAAARFNLASARRGQGAPADALALFGSLEGVFADEGIYHANVGRTLEDLGDRAGAIAAYHRALEMNPGEAFLLERLAALGELVHAFGPEGEPIYVDASDFAESVRQDLAAHADDADYLAGVAEVLLAQGHADLARNAAELTLAAQPDDPAALLFAGMAQADLGHPTAALGYLDRHVAIEPRSAAGHAQRARVLLDLARIDEAREAAQTAFELDPNDLIAVQAAVAGDDGPDAVLGRIDALIALRSTAWAPWRLAGDVRSTAGDAEGALGSWRRAVDLGADDLTIGTYLGELGRAGRIEELVEVVDGLTRLADREPGLRWNAASGYAEAGRLAEARIIFASIAHDQRVAPDMRAAAAERASAPE